MFLIIAYSGLVFGPWVTSGGLVTVRPLMDCGHIRRSHLLGPSPRLLISLEVQHVRCRNPPQPDPPRSFRPPCCPAYGCGKGSVQSRTVVATWTATLVSLSGFSFLQKFHVSDYATRSCTCPGEDHPNPGKGRGAPEIDVFEGERNKTGAPGGIVSQSAQFAPFTADYLFDNSTSDKYTIFNRSTTVPNNYRGSAVCVTASPTLWALWAHFS
jgi:hypothetical protein